VKDRISGLKEKIDIKEKKKNCCRKELRTVKTIFKNTDPSSKDQTCKSWE
jgi:hypothetical protein